MAWTGGCRPGTSYFLSIRVPLPLLTLCQLAVLLKVGAAIAAGSHLEKGIRALLVKYIFDFLSTNTTL